MTHQSGVEPTLVEFLRARARRASDARLAIDVGAGLVVLLFATLWHGEAWLVLATASLAVLAYGAWGITDREIAERIAVARDVMALRVGRVVAVVVGVTAAIGFILSAFAIVLGPIKS
jgi:hypothetical protein